MLELGEKIARSLEDGGVIELVGDVGAGKTTLVKGIGKEMGITQTIQSPSYTIFCQYDTPKKSLHHYDFYRLNDPGIVSFDLEESIAKPHTITVVEWADSVAGVLPNNHIKIHIQTTGENEREVTLQGVEV